MRAWILALTVLLLVVASPVHATGASPLSGFSMNLSTGVANVSLTVRVFQNLTLLDKSFSLPQGNGTIIGSNATQIADSFQNALRVKSASAVVKDVSGTVESSAWNATTSAQWLNLTINFDVDGISVNRYGGTTVDAAWRSFAVPSNITLSGIELNQVGATYLESFAAFLQGLTNSRTITYTYRVNQLAIAQSRIPGVVPSMRLFNFSSLSTPLSKWSSTYNATSNSIVWSLSPLPTYGITVVEIVTEVEQSTLKYELSYSFNQATITTPLRSSVTGDTILIVFGDSQETLMALIIASSSAIAVGTTFYERRVLRKVPKKRSRR